MNSMSEPIKQPLSPPTSGTSPSETTGVGSSESVQTPEVAKAKVENLSVERQKETFAEPLNKDTQTNAPTGGRNRAFSNFFTAASNLRVPVSLPVQSARSAYASFIEARGEKKEQATIKELEKRCDMYGISPGDKTSKSNTEVINDLKGQIAAKENEINKEFVGLVDVCVKGKYMDETDEGFSVGNPGLRDDLSSKTLKLIEGNKKTVPTKEFLNAIEELKSAVRSRPALQIVQQEIQDKADLVAKSASSKAEVKSNETLIPMEMKEEISVEAKEVPKAGLQSVPVKSLNIQALSEREVAQFESSGNAVKDFIKCGTGFKTEEATVGDVTQKIRVKNDKVNAQTMAAGLGVTYPLAGKAPNAESTGAEFKDLKEAMQNAKESLNPEDNSAQGSLAQADRVLDLSIAILESNLYNPSIKADLNKGEDSQIRGLLNQASEINQNHPEFESLKLKKEQLEGLILKHAKGNAEIEKPSNADVKAFQQGLSDIRKGKLSEEQLNQYAQNMARDSGDIFMSLYKNMDSREFIEGGKGYDKVSDFQHKLNFSTVEFILEGKTKSEIKNSIEFFTKVAQAAIDKGDFQTAFCIFLAVQNSNLTRLYETSNYIKLSPETENTLKNQATLLTSFNHKILRSAENEFKSKGVPIPLLSIHAGDAKGTGEASVNSLDVPKNEKGLKTPNSEKIISMGSFAKSFGAINNVEGGSGNAFKGFSSVLDYHNTKITSETINEREKDLNAFFEKRSLDLQPRGDAQRKRALGFGAGDKPGVWKENIKPTIEGSEPEKNKRFSIFSGKPQTKNTDDPNQRQTI